MSLLLNSVFLDVMYRMILFAAKVSVISMTMTNLYVLFSKDIEADLKALVYNPILISQE